MIGTAGTSIALDQKILGAMFIAIALKVETRKAGFSLIPMPNSIFDRLRWKQYDA